MVIDINSISPTPPGKPQNNGAGNAVPDQSNSNKVASKASPAVEQDSVELSNTAQDLGRIQQALQELPAVDTERVEAIQQQIADGSYSVDADEVAARILSDDQNFLV